MRPLLLDVSHTAHTRARTGIQRVTRSLRAALGGAAVPITFDPYASLWRTLAPWEEANLAATAPAAKRGAQWPLAARWRGRLRRWWRRTDGALPAEAGGLVVPEIFAPSTAAALPALCGAVRGPRVALFHDAIALQWPELTPPKTVGRFPGYLLELAAFDGIAAVSADSRQVLLEYWRWAQVPAPPPVEAIPLGVDLPATAEPAPDDAVPTVLSVGSIEARKNHLALLEAAERLWARGRRFELRLIGLAHAETGRPALERLRALQAAGRPLRYGGPADDATVHRAYARCAFTVYPSLVEGFGLPVLESVAYGKPCICSRRGALGEAAAGGGCVALDDVTPEALAAAMDRLLTRPQDRHALAAAARGRRLRRWADYAQDLQAWLSTLERRTR